MSKDEFKGVLDTLDDLRAASRAVEISQWDDKDFCTWIEADTQIGIEHSGELRRLAARLRYLSSTGYLSLDAETLIANLDYHADRIWQTQGGEA